MEGGDRTVNNVENRIVEMKFDNSQFEQAVAQTMSTLDKFKEKLNFEDAGKGIDRLGTATGNYTGILGGISSAIDSVADHFSNLSGVGERVFSALTSAATGFLTSGLNKLTSDVVQGGQSRAMNLEQAKFQLSGILGDAQEVNRVIYEDILPELQGTPFSLDQAAVVMGQLAASGKTSSEEVRQGTRAIAGAAAMTNSSFAEMGRIFTKVAGNGRVMGDTLQEMSSRGLNAAADMGKVFNMTEAEVREAVTAGQISYDMFAEAMDKLYGEQAQKSTTMYTGALEDLRAALARIGAEPQAVKLEFLRDAFNALVPAVDAVNAVLKPWINSAHDTEEYIDENGEKATRYAKAFKGPLAQSIQQTGWAFQSLFVTLDDNHDIMRYTAESLEQMGYEFEEAEDGTRSYFEVLEDGTKVYHDVGEAIMNHDMLRIMTSSAQSFVNVAAALGKLLKAIGQGILDAFPKLGLKNIADFVDGVEAFTKKLILSDETLQNVKFVVQALFTPLGLLTRAVLIAAKVFVEFGKLVYKAVAPVMKTIMSIAGAASGIFSGLGKAVDNAAADISGMAARMYEAAKSFAQFLKLDKLVGYLSQGLAKLTVWFTKVGVTSYNFLSSLSENAKKAAHAIYEKLRIDEFTAKIKGFYANIRAIVAGRGGLLGFLGLEKVAQVFYRLKEAITTFFTAAAPFERVGNAIKSFGLKVLNAIPTDTILKGLTAFGNALVRITIAIGDFARAKSEMVINFFTRIGKVIKRVFSILSTMSKYFGVIDTLKMAFAAFVRMIPKMLGFKNFADILDTVKNKIKSFIEVFKEFIDSVVNGFTGNTKRLGQNMKDGLNNLVDDKISKKIKSFSDVVKALGETLGKIGKGIGNKIRDFFQALKEGDKTKVIKTLSLLLIAFGYLKTITKVGKTVSNVGKTVKVFRTFMEGVSGFASSIKGVATAIKRMTYLIAFTTSLLIFATALSLLGRLDMPTLVQGGIAAIGSLIALATAMWILDKVAGKTPEGANKIMKLGVAMAAVGAAVYLMAKSMEKLAIIYNSMDTKGYIAVIATLAGMIVAFGILAKVFSGMEKMEVSLKSAGLAMLAIATSIKIMVGAMAAIGGMDMGTLLKGGIAISAILGLMVALTYFAGRNENVAKTATALATLTASLLALAGAVWIFSKMDWATWGAGLLKMAGALVVLLAVLSIFKSVSGPAQAGGIILIAVAMGVLAGALLLLSAVPFIPLVKALGSLAIGIIVVAAAMALFSGIGIGMLAVAGAFALLGVAMLFVGAGALALTVALTMLVPLFMALSQIPKELVQGGLDVLATIAAGLKDMFFDLAKGVLAFGAALLVAAVAAVILGAGILAIGAGLVIVGVGLLALAGGIAVLALTIQAIFGGEFLSTIGQMLTNFGTMVATGLTGIVDKVKGVFSKDKGKEATQAFIDGGEEAVDESSPDFESSWNGVLTEMISAGGEKKSELFSTMKDFMSSGAEGVESGSPELTEAFGGELGELESLASDSGVDISSILGNIPADAGSSITQNSGKYTSALSTMFSSGQKESKKATDDNKKAAKETAKAYSDGLATSEATKAVEKSSKTLKDSATKALKNVKSDFKPIGSDAAEGFKQGINSKVDSVANAAADMVRAAMRAAKSAQNSNSPSKEFAKFGQWADEGYILGIKSMSGEVARAASDMVSGGLNAITEVMSNLSSVPELNDLNPTITPVVDLTNVDQSVNQIGSMFGNAFGIGSPLGSMNAAFAAQSFADSRNQNEKMDSINRLASKLDTMTDTMNSRALNNYITVDGAADPEAFADGLIRSFRLNARTV